MNLFNKTSTLPPAASPHSVTDLLSGLTGVFNPSATIRQFHASLSGQLNKKFCFSYSSGKAALAEALHTLRTLQPDCKGVVVPAFNCYSVPSAIIDAGCTVIPCETDPSTLDFDESALREIIRNNNHLLAVCPTHLFGLPANIDRVRKLLAGTTVTIIEDAAQAMGTALAGHPQLCTGDVILFSLGRGKALSAGEGGILLTDHEPFASVLQKRIDSITGYSSKELIKLLLQTLAMFLLINPRFFTLPANLPFLKLGETLFEPDFPTHTLSGIQAGFAGNWIKRLTAFNAVRMGCAQHYYNGLSQLNSIQTFWNPSAPTPSIRFPVLFDSEKTAAMVFHEGRRNGLGIARTYPEAIDRIPQLNIPPDQRSVHAQNIALRLLTLPCHKFVTAKDIGRIVEVIAQAAGISCKL